MATDVPALVLDASGRSRPLGAFLADLLDRSGRSVVDVAERAHVSRSFFYLVRDDTQVPSVESLVGLLEALDVDSVRPAMPDEPGDLAVTVDGTQWWVRLPHAGRRAARSRAALQSLAASSPPRPPIRASQVEVDAALPAPPPAPAALAGTSGVASFAVHGGVPTPQQADPRARQLADLVRLAEGLDADRLRLLIEHARLLQRG